MSYHFSINKYETGYYFVLYPNNNNGQEIGISNCFADYNEALKQLERFRSIVVSTPEPFKIETKNNHYYFYLNTEDNSLQFNRVRGYVEKQNCKKGIKAIQKNINAPLV